LQNPLFIYCTNKNSKSQPKHSRRSLRVVRGRLSGQRSRHNHNACTRRHTRVNLHQSWQRRFRRPMRQTRP
jgi:hypothetical protein